MLVPRIRGDLLKGLEDAPLFPEDLEDGGKEEEQGESHGQLDEVTPGGQPFHHYRETERQLGTSNHFDDKHELNWLTFANYLN